MSETTTEVCVGCTHLIGKHFMAVDGKVRCLVTHHGFSDSGVLGIPYSGECDCVDYVSENTTRRREKIEQEQREHDAAMQRMVDEIKRKRTP